jgi:hypothetical protein
MPLLDVINVIVYLNCYKHISFHFILISKSKLCLNLDSVICYKSRVNAYRQEYGGIIQLKAVKRKESKEEWLQEDRVDLEMDVYYDWVTIGGISVAAAAADDDDDSGGDGGSSFNRMHCMQTELYGGFAENISVVFVSV